MATITIRNIPDFLYDSYKQLALENKRSLNNELIVALEISLDHSVKMSQDQKNSIGFRVEEDMADYGNVAKRKLESDPRAEEMKKIRAITAICHLTPAEIRQAIREGRA